MQQRCSGQTCWRPRFTAGSHNLQQQPPTSLALQRLSPTSRLPTHPLAHRINTSVCLVKPVSISGLTCNFRRRHLLHAIHHTLPHSTPHSPCPGKVGTTARIFWARTRLTLPPAYVDQRCSSFYQHKSLR
jgi:hypothetical protein